MNHPGYASGKPAPQPPGPQPGLPQPAQGRSAIGKLDADLLTGAAGTLNCFASWLPPQWGQAGVSLERTPKGTAELQDRPMSQPLATITRPARLAVFHAYPPAEAAVE